MARTPQDPDLSDNESYESFIQNGQETFQIDGREIVVENAEHVIIDGGEYVLIDDQLYRINSSPRPQASQKPLSSGLTKIAAILIVALIVFAGGYFVLGPLIKNGSVFPGTVKESSQPTQSYEEHKAQAFKSAMDYTNPVTRDYALTLIPKNDGGNYNIAQICDLWDAVYNKWTYVNDPNGDDYKSPASRTIQLGLKGDCDDFAITVASLIESIGGSTRIVTARNSAGKGHAYPEVLIAKSKSEFDSKASYIAKRYHISGEVACHTVTRNDTTYYWLNLDWQSRYPGGKFFNSTDPLTIYYPSGYWYKTG